MQTTTRLVALFTIGVIAIAPASRVSAQDKPFNGIRPADLRAHAIVGARVVTAPGQVLDHATVILRDGVIEAVGPALAVPADVRVWSGEGLTVYAGLIDAAVVVDAPDLPDAVGRHWNKMVHPELALADHPLPGDDLGKSLRKLGFTTAAIYPDHGIFRGSGAVIALTDSPAHARTYDPRAAMAMSFDRAGTWGSPATPGSLMGVIAIMRQTFMDGGWHAESTRVYREHSAGNEPPAPAEALVAIADVLARRQSTLFITESELDILRAARIAAEFDLDPMYLGSGTEFRRLDEVVGTGAPIIVPVNFPKRPDLSVIHRADSVSLRDMMTWEQAPTNPRRLVDAGATIALTTQGLENRRDFPAALAKVIQHGLAEDAALAALTTVPAKLLGLEDVMGTIEPGKLANLVVVEGSLFDKKPKIRDTWINGRRYEIEPAPATTLAFTGTLRLEDGRTFTVDLDTKKPSMTVHTADGEKTKAKKVEVVKDRLGIVVDGEAFGVQGWVRLGGATTGGSVTGTGAMPDGSRFTFVIEPEPGLAAATSGAEEKADDAADDGISGEWILSIVGDRRSFDLTVDLDHDNGGLTGAATVMGMEIDVEGGTFDADTGKIAFDIVSAGGRKRSFEGTVTGNDVSGTTSSSMGEGTFEGTRRRGDEEDDFQMPPDALATPLGAYGQMEPPRPQDVFITNATIWTAGPRGIIENGSMIVSGGKIQAIGTGLRAPSGAQVIDAAGRHVSPGLIDCHSHTGISGGVNEFPEANTAEVRIGDVIDPDDVNWYRQLAGGLTAANQLHGSANPIGGQNSVVKLKWGGRADDLPIADAIPGIKFALGENVKRSQNRYPNTRMGVETFIRDAFTAARAYRQKWNAYRSLPDYQRRSTIPPRRDIEMDTLVEIMDGKRLVHCHSYRQDEILMLIRVADEFGFTIGTFQHVLEGYKVADAMAHHGAGGSSFSDWWAYKVEVMDAIPHNGALMTDVGVVVSFNSDSSELARRMNTEASKAVRYGGVEPAEAIKFVTLNPAKQLRIDHRTGSLEVGKDADFVIWSASPLSTYARCEQTWIEGVRYFELEQDLAMRATVRSERQRLIQKILADAHGEPTDMASTAGEKTPSKRPTDAFANLPESAQRWLEERWRLGEDPMETVPGDCGCGGLFELAGHKH